MRGLQNKVAVITGGLGDLGFATAERLSEEGCRIAILDKEPQKKISLPDACTFYQVDISNEKQTEEICKQVINDLGPVEILVNTATCFIFKGVEADTNDWNRILSVNIAGTSFVTHFISDNMKQQRKGSIINFSSVSGFVGQKNFATYNATKFAIRGLTKCWAQDMAPFGIRVNTICPGYIFTRAFVNSCQALGLNPEEENRKASELHLLGRQGEPKEVAATVAFLASDDSSFMTGSDLIVDGGYLAR